MSVSDTAATKDAIIDEIPSLDVLSFEHEHCPSSNCLCHNRKHLLNNRNSSGLSAFGVQTTPPVFAQRPVSNSSQFLSPKDSVSNPGVPLLQSSFLPLSTQSPNIAHCSSDAASVVATHEGVFGSGSSHGTSDAMQSFSQLCHTASTSESAAVGQPLAFEHGHRSAVVPNDLTRDIDLSELQSVLLTTAEELTPVSDCRVHRHAPTVERVPACTCGQQASRVDDCTCDELAAYFDNFCYIPKNMSPMAEMMYM